MSTEPDKPEGEESTKAAVTGSLLGALGFMEGEKKPAEDPAPDPAPDPIEDPAPDPEPEPVKLSAKNLKITAVKPSRPAPEPEPAPEPKPAPEPEPAPYPDPEPEPDKLAHLAQNERDTVELLQFGEWKELTGKGTSEKLVDYYTRRQGIIEKLVSENEFEEDYRAIEDPQYKKWLRANKPPVDVQSLEKIRTEKLLETAEERALEKFRAENAERDKQWDDMMKRQDLEKALPAIEKTVDDFSDQLLADMPEEITTELKAGKKWDTVAEESPIEAPIVKSVLGEFRDRAEVLASIYAGVTPINPNDPLQASLISFVSTQADLLAKQPEEKTARNGKAFVKPQEFNGDDSTWTFTQADVLTMLRKSAANTAKSRIDKEKKRYESYLKKTHKEAPNPNGGTPPHHSAPQVKPSASGTPAGPSKGGRSGGLFGVLNG